MRYYGNMLDDGGGYDAPQSTTVAPPTTTTSPSSVRFSDAYLDYRTGERQSSTVVEQTKSSTITVEQAKTAGATGDYSQLNKIIKDPEAYSAFKEARMDRFKSARTFEAPQNPSTISPSTITPAPITQSETSVVSFSQNTYVDPTPSTPSTITSKPSNISPVTQTPPPPPVKTAAIDTILFDEEAIPIQIMSDLIFENIGGQELINVARNDTVNGQQIIYQPIKNLTQIQQEYNPNNILAIQATSDKYFQNYAIKFESKVPTDGGGPNGEHVYIDSKSGSLIVEAVNIQEDEQIEVEITTGGTIYEAELW